jgi:hypothetical protein
MFAGCRFSYVCNGSVCYMKPEDRFRILNATPATSYIGFICEVYNVVCCVGSCRQPEEWMPPTASWNELYVYLHLSVFTSPVGRTKHQSPLKGINN